MNPSEIPADPLRAFASPSRWRPAGIAFRPVVDGDLPLLQSLYATVRREELAPVPWSDEQKRAFLDQQCVLQHQHYVANYPGADLLLVLRGGEPIGRIYVFRSAREIRLMDIALFDPERGKGLGTALLQELLDEARRTERRLTLHVEPDNPAQRLYRRLGFELIENRGVYDFLGCSPAPIS
jgi:GNAT superfamily N-acetyltransferase